MHFIAESTNKTHWDKETSEMKMAVFWDVMSCCLVDVDQYFKGAYCLHHQDKVITQVM
jgi:hypothetical protein